MRALRTRWAMLQVICSSQHSIDRLVIDEIVVTA